MLSPINWPTAFKSYFTVPRDFYRVNTGARFAFYSSFSDGYKELNEGQNTSFL
jgi:hypothetical protein